MHLNYEEHRDYADICFLSANKPLKVFKCAVYSVHDTWVAG